ncbi:MAG TPA: cytochrome P450 [Mycobacteriales bacterium]|nr:cytochrome P450 [Mycobacteriales bacterium]
MSSPVTTKGDHPVNPAVDLVSGEFWGRNPHDELTWLRENAPVYWDGRVWGIASHADLKSVSLQPKLFCNGGGIRPDNGPVAQFIDLDGAEHKRRRNLINRGFTPRRLTDSVGRINEICNRIVDNVIERGECDAVKDMAAWLPMHAIGDMLGFPEADRADLLKWSDDMMCALDGKTESIVSAAAAYGGFREFCLKAIEDRRRNPGNDLLSLLIAGGGADGGEVDIDDLIHDSLLILIGGDETTRHVISGGLYQLLRNADAKQALIDDPSKIPTAVEEMLRWVSPIKNMARTVVEDTELNGQRLEAGDKLLLLYGSANRDATVFVDPFRFDIARTPNDHVAFGIGTHFCLGNNLARLELRCFFETILRRMPDLELVDETEPAYRPANFVSGYESMPVRFTPSFAE